MRGRTLENCYIILDEAQNTTKIQMKMFLTRLGKNSKMVVVGDNRQIDLISKIGIILFERIDWVSKSIFNIKNNHATPVPIKELKKCAKKLSSIIRLKTNGTIIIDHQGNDSVK